MRVVIAGGSGFLGQALADSLGRHGHEVQILTRRPRGPGHIAWTPDGDPGPWAASLEGAGAVVNLAGEGIADRRWTPARKAALVESRIRATTSLVRAVRERTTPPAVFVSASGIGYYGATGDEPVDESAPPGSDFLAQLAVQWEHAAAPAGTACRLVLLRTGMVLGHGGALQQMLLPFKLGLGGRLGSGRQWMPWIHVDDWVALVERLIADERASGPFNLAAPAPVRNREFTRALGHALSRPAFLPVPAFALSLAFGELAQVLLTGQRAVPHRAEQLGFTFAYSSIDVALAAAVR
ncbi:MAG: TIGR01777 family oxidoreductase [Vicinamibacterales bacterium]